MTLVFGMAHLPRLPYAHKQRRTEGEMLHSLLFCASGAASSRCLTMPDSDGCPKLRGGGGGCARRLLQTRHLIFVMSDFPRAAVRTCQRAASACRVSVPLVGPSRRECPTRSYPSCLLHFATQLAHARLPSPYQLLRARSYPAPLQHLLTGAPTFADRRSNIC